MPVVTAVWPYERFSGRHDPDRDRQNTFNVATYFSLQSHNRILQLAAGDNPLADSLTPEIQAALPSRLYLSGWGILTFHDIRRGEVTVSPYHPEQLIANPEQYSHDFDRARQLKAVMFDDAEVKQCLTEATH